MKDRWLLQFHEDLEACIAHIIDEAKSTWPSACRLGNVDVSPVMLRYLWHKSLCKRPSVFNSYTCRQAIKEVEKKLSSLIGFKAVSVTNPESDNWNWHTYLEGQENKVLVFVTSSRILDNFRPLINALEEEFILLTTTPIPEQFNIPDNVTVVRLRMPKAKLFHNAELEQALPWFYNFANAIGWFIEILRPKLLICMDGCQSEYRLAAAFCNEKHIPSICLQSGWPSYLHTGFRDLPYTYFFTWGDKFNPLWEEYNRHTRFIATGYMNEVTSKGDHSAITFFLQAPVYLNTETYLDRICNLIQTTAIYYPNIPILVREHPEYRGKTKQLANVIQYHNVHIVNNDKLSEVYARTKVVISHFSSVLMEGLIYGCIPLVFNPTPGFSYSPDIEEESLGLISNNEEEFFTKLSYCLFQIPSEELTQWFKASGKKAVRHAIKIIHNILSKYDEKHSICTRQKRQ